LFLRYLHNVQNKVFVVPLESLEKAVELNEIASDDAYANVSITHDKVDSVITTAQTSDWIGLRDAEQLDLPVGCSVSSVSARHDNSRVFVHSVGYTLAARVYEYKFNPPGSLQANGCVNVKETKQNTYGKLSIWRESVVDGFKPDQWVVEQVWVPNPNDGVKIPMFIIRDKSVVKTGDSFCLLYGYSANNIFF
jgi:prolyl oligopeptidase PreP (S9A serine peptidase family)